MPVLKIESPESSRGQQDDFPEKRCANVQEHAFAPEIYKHVIQTYNKTTDSPNVSFCAVDSY